MFFGGPINTSKTARTAIVAEDEALIRLDIVEILKDHGFDIIAETGNGEDAVRLVRELKPGLLVMDIKMPKLDGLSAAKKITEETVTPIVFLTAFSQKELVDRATEAGAMAYVVKPFTQEDLIPAIEVAMARYAQIMSLNEEVTSLAGKFEARKLIDRAKGLLSDKMGLSEADAFRWIQKASMDRRLSMSEVAKAIIEQLAEPKESKTG